MSELYDQQLQFGKVQEVDGHEVVIAADTLTCLWKGQTRIPVELGGFIVLRAPSAPLVAVVSGIFVGEAKRGAQSERSNARGSRGGNDTNLSLFSNDRKLVTCTMVGYLWDGQQFRRGISRYPTYETPAYLLLEDSLRTMFQYDSEHWLTIGQRHQRGSGAEHVRIDKMYGRHTAVLGTTGSGKSWTVASLMQQVMRRMPHARIVFFDLHNEYNQAFPADDPDFRARHIRSSTLRLPYWCLNADEISELFASQEHRAENQSAFIRETVRNLRVRAAGELNIDEDEVSVDSPIYYNFADLLNAIKDEHNGGKSLKGKLQNLILRIEAKHKDPRYTFLFPETCKSNASLKDVFEDLFGISDGHKISVIDLSGLPSDVLSTIIGILCRLIFEYKYWEQEPGHMPLLLALEEAHNYLPKSISARYASCSESIERIAKEGRKYGLSLFVISQRPSELNETVLSQCSNFVALRLTNPTDQEYVRRMLPDFVSVMVDMLPFLRTGEAVLAGEAVTIPTRVVINEPNPRPRSDDVDYLKGWREGPPPDYSVGAVIDRWRQRER